MLIYILHALFSPISNHSKRTCIKKLQNTQLLKEKTHKTQSITKIQTYQIDTPQKSTKISE